MRFQMVPALAGWTNVDCPVSDAMIAALYRASLHDAVALARLLPDEQRARLAVFCFRQTFLESIGRAIATACSEASLLGVEPDIGEALLKTRWLPPQRESRVFKDASFSSLFDGEAVAI